MLKSYLVTYSIKDNVIPDPKSKKKIKQRVGKVVIKANDPYKAQHKFYNRRGVRKNGMVIKTIKEVNNDVKVVKSKKR